MGRSDKNDIGSGLKFIYKIITFKYTSKCPILLILILRYDAT